MPLLIHISNYVSKYAVCFREAYHARGGQMVQWIATGKEWMGA